MLTCVLPWFSCPGFCSCFEYKTITAHVTDSLSIVSSRPCYYTARSIHQLEMPSWKYVHSPYIESHHLAHHLIFFCYNQGAAGVNGPIVVPLWVGPTATVNGTMTFVVPFSASDLSANTLGLDDSSTPTERFTTFDSLLASQGLYCNYHTKVNPGGELRGQL